MKKAKNDFIYDAVNKQILDQLEKGNIPWRMPWKTNFPVNLISKKEYEGFNWWMLLIEQMVKGYKSNVWATFKQVTDKGGKVKKGEKSTMVIYWKILEIESATKKDKNGKPKIEKIPLLRYYNVFNLDQTEGIEIKAEDKVQNINLDAENIIEHYKEQITMKAGGNQAFYSPKEDYIQIPAREQFISDEGFYSTNFHEMVHSTGHKKRLNRFGDNYSAHFGSESYSKEELIAEMGSAYLCAKTGILPQTIENKGAYIQSWLKALKDDKTLLVSAGGKAQKAVEFILK
jgi:antirestriction protein ArdC